MDLRLLRYFVAVAEELSFTRAAERLNIAQPPLSQQIQRLEERLGVLLLRRTRRSVELTDSGRVYLEEARAILQAVDAAAVKAQRAERGEVGRLAVGFFEHTSYTILPPILRAYRERYPKVEVELRWFPVVEQAAALRRGDVDIAFMRAVPDMERVTRTVLLREPFVLALPAGHRLAAAASVALEDCAEENLISYTPRAAPDFNAMIVRMCADAGFVPRVAVEISQVYTGLGLVSSGAGLAFVPATVRQVKLDHVVYRPLRAPTPRSDVMLGWVRQTPSPLLAGFVETARAAIADLEFAVADRSSD